MAAAAAAAVWLAGHVQMLGEMPGSILPDGRQRDMGLDYAVGLFWWSLFAVGLWLLGGSDRQHLLIAWVAKFFVVLVLMLFYEYKYRYNLDAYSYFNTVLTGRYFMYEGVDWRNESWVPSFTKTIEVQTTLEAQLVTSPGTENMLKLLMAIAQVTGPYYHAIKVVFSFFGFLGVLFIYRAMVVILGRPFHPVFYVLMLYPSILFWSSILGKDPLFLFFLGLYAYGATLWLVRENPAGLALIGSALSFIYMLRTWMAVVAGAPLALAMLVRQFGAGAVIIVSLVVVPMLWLTTGLGERFQMLEANALIEELATRAEGQTAGGSGAGLSFAEAQALLQTPGGIVIVVFSGLFRPLPFDASNALVAVAAVENSVLLLMALKALWCVEWAAIRSPVFLWLTTYSLTWAGAYGLVVLANFGAGMRYKLQVLPFLVLLLLFLLHPEARVMVLGRTRSRALEPRKTE